MLLTRNISYLSNKLGKSFAFSSDDSTKTVEELFEKIAQSELTKLSSELSDDDFEMVNLVLRGLMLKTDDLFRLLGGDLENK